MSTNNNRKLKRYYVILVFFALVFKGFSQPKNIVPTPEQVVWANSEMGVIIHLDINIYAPESFDYKKPATLPDVNKFNPSRLNTDQWIRIAKAAGAKYAILTVKHGTGFCLWPSKVNSYNVGHTKWKNGQEDILKNFISSCRKYGLKPGLYYNTNINTYYDAGNNPFKSDSAHLAYNQAVLQQLTELWSNYGKMFEIWFDGGISSEKTFGIEDQVLKLIKSRQPNAILFQGPLIIKNIIRWVGNENGIAAYPQWSRCHAPTSSNGIASIEDLHGNPAGEYWCPAESDFPIRRNNAWNGGWLWKAGQESYLFGANEIIDKYLKSVGRNTNMLIGMVVDTSGLIPLKDSLVFDSIGKKISALYKNRIAGIEHTHAQTIVLAVPLHKKISRIVIMEDNSYGENIRKYQIAVLVHNKWQTILLGRSIGHKRIEQFAAIDAQKIRLQITAHSGSVNIREFSVY